MTHLPEDAAVWRTADPRGGWTRTDLLAWVTERRVTALWATVATALGQEITDTQLADPIDTIAPAPVEPEVAEVKSLREIAIWMRSG